MQQAMNIIKAGNAILRTVATKITIFNTKELHALVGKLFFNMHHYNGVGLAAPQIGISQRIIVYGFSENIRYPNIASIKKTVLINPEISFYSEEKGDFYEGCLSLPNIRGVVSRSNYIQLTAQDIKGKFLNMEVSGFEARIIQHELDHLDGILFPMRMSDLSTLIYSDN